MYSTCNGRLSNRLIAYTSPDEKKKRLSFRPVSTRLVFSDSYYSRPNQPLHFHSHHHQLLRVPSIRLDSLLHQMLSPPTAIQPSRPTATMSLPQPANPPSPSPAACCPSHPFPSKPHQPIIYAIMSDFVFPLRKPRPIAVCVCVVYASRRLSKMRVRPSPMPRGERRRKMCGLHTPLPQVK